MKSKLSSSTVLFASIVAVGCSAASDDTGGEELSQVEQAAATGGDPWALDPSAVWNSGTKAVDAIKAFYEGINWFNCRVLGACPASDARVQATRVISELSSLIEKNEQNRLIAPVTTLMTTAEQLYDHPEDLANMQDQPLFFDAVAVYDNLHQKISNTNPTVAAEVESAYQLAPVFNVAAALVDNIFQQMLKRRQNFMSQQLIDATRKRTLELNNRLVGAQSLWLQCAGSAAATQMNTVERYDNSLPTRILWGKFANYVVSRSCTNAGGTSFFDCNPFDRVTSPSRTSCPRTRCTGFCAACTAPLMSPFYAQEVPKIIARMDRDPNVVTVRAATERLVGLAAHRGAGLLFRTPSGMLDLWNVWSPTSYKPTTLAGADPNVWKVVGSGDFNGDGNGDVLWINTQDSSVGVWPLAAGQVTTMTSPTRSHRFGSVPYIGDLDGDGVSDIIWTGTLPVGTQGGTVYSYMTDTWMMNPSSTIPRSIASNSSSTEQVQGIGKFGGDGRADILFREPASGIVTVAVTGGPKIRLGQPTTDWSIKGIGDFNGDRSSDILWLNTNGNVAVWAIRDGGVIADVTTGWVDPAWGYTIQGVADVDHDGISDIVWRHTGGQISTWMMAGPSSIREHATVASNAQDAFAGVIDLGPPLPENAQNRTVSESTCGATTGVLRNAGFLPYEQWWSNTFHGGNGTFTGDVDGDRRSDLVSLGSNYVGVIRSTGSSFGGYEQWRNESLLGNRGTVLGDVNGDSKADLVLFHHDGITNNAFLVYPSNGQRFTDRAVWRWGLFDGGRGKLIGDVNGDALADLVLLDDASVTVAKSTGSGFSANEKWWTGAFYGVTGRTYPTTLLVDVDGNGKADLVAIGPQAVFVARSDGGRFGNVETWWEGTTSEWVGVYLGDVNGDGKADLVTAGTNSVNAFRSTGQKFGSRETWWGNAFYANLANLVGDIDGNSRADLLALGGGYIGALRSQ